MDRSQSGVNSYPGISYSQSLGIRVLGMMSRGIRFVSGNKSRGVLVDGRQASVSRYYSGSDDSSLSIGILVMVS
ncbi:hypothetical protein ES708_26781 [subsurface metagenome]